MGGSEREQVPFPKTAWLMHNRTDLLTPAQRARYDALVRLSDLLNRTLRDDMERTTGKYLPMLYTEFLEKLYRTVRALEAGEAGLLMDDFIRIAHFSLPALKHIAAHPSTQIVKEAAKVPTSQVRRTDAATMRWLSRRPGRTVGEKIAPRNQVLTKVTRFTADTKENRETVYLYGILHDVVLSRVKAEGGGRGALRDRELTELLSLHTRIRRGDLAEAPPVKQTLQNNKLMCDKYYKMVWDAVGQLSAVEEKLEKDWENLEERYLQIGFWAVLGQLLHCTETAVYDCRGTLRDEGGRLWFDGDCGDPRSATLYALADPERSFRLYMGGSLLILEDGEGETLAEQDLLEGLDWM